MFENLMNIFKKTKKSKSLTTSSKNTAKERLHLVLMQDRANVSADFLDLMRKEIIEVIKKYIDIDEKAMDVRLTTETNEDGTQGAPALYANIPIINIKDETRKNSRTNQDRKIEIKLTEKKNKTEIENKDIVKDTTNEEKQNNTETKEKEDVVEEPKKEENNKEEEKTQNVENNKENGENQNLDNNKEENKTVDNQESTKDTSENKEEDNNEE